MPYKDKKCGIYCIENLVTNKKYIGQSSDILNRWCTHKMRLRRNQHSNQHLQASWNKYGEEKFKFYILELCLAINLNERETYYINLHRTIEEKYGYNLCTGGDADYKFTDEVKLKISLAGKGRPVSDKTRRLISESQKGRRLPEEWKNNISKHHKQAIASGAMTVNTIGLANHNNEVQKSINYYDKNNVFLGSFKSVQEAGRQLGLPATNICKVLKGKYKYCGGFKFAYK